VVKKEAEGRSWARQDRKTSSSSSGASHRQLQAGGVPGGKMCGSAEGGRKMGRVKVKKTGHGGYSPVLYVLVAELWVYGCCDRRSWRGPLRIAARS